MSRLDNMVKRIMDPYYYLNQDGSLTIDASSAELNGYNTAMSPNQCDLSGAKHRDVQDGHEQFIRQLGAPSTVLLKNTKGSLPLEAPKISVFLEMAPWISRMASTLPP